jgi:hypothetical protein
MERTRRDVLGVAGLSLTALAAGCLERSAESGTPTANGTDTPTETDTPTDTPTLPDGLRRVDQPPYDIEQTECADPVEGDGRDPLYLCANMATEPSLSFTQATTSGNILDDGGLELGEGDDDGDWMYATLLTDEDDRDRLAEERDDEPAQLIRQADFETHAVLVVQTGWGSGSVQPHVERVESTETGVHAFGCHTDPCIQTDDFTSRTAAVRFERPETLESGVVSLTVAPDERWTVAAGEGVVTIP